MAYRKKSHKTVTLHLYPLQLRRLDQIRSYIQSQEKEGRVATRSLAVREAINHYHVELVRQGVVREC